MSKVDELTKLSHCFHEINQSVHWLFLEEMFSFMKQDCYETVIVDFKNSASVLSFQNKNGSWEVFRAVDEGVLYSLGYIVYNVLLEGSGAAVYSPRLKLEGSFSFSGVRYHFLSLPGSKEGCECKIFITKMHDV